MRLFNKYLIAALLLTFTFQSCIELEEYIIIHPDKSGDYSLTLDMSALTSMSDDFGIPEDLLHFPEFISEALKDVTGISNIKANSDESIGIYMVSFHFVNHKAFKRALLKLAGLKYGFIVPNYMKVGKHRFKKKNVQPMIAKAIEKSENTFLNQSFMGAEASSFITVKTIIETPKPVKKIKKNGRARKTEPNIVEIKSTLTEIIEGMNVGVVIKY